MTREELKKIVSYVNDEKKEYYTVEDFIYANIVEIDGEKEVDEVVEEVIEGKTYLMDKSDIVFVDLGLPYGTLWMDRNIGAKSETDLGFHFHLGETIGYEKFGGDNRTELGNVWNSNGSLKIEKDAAYTYTDGMAVIPTKKQCKELMDNTYVRWWRNFKKSGVEGAQIISKINNNYIFIPDCDYAGGVAVGTKNTDKDCEKYNYYGYEFSQQCGHSWSYSDGYCYIGNSYSFKKLLVRGVKK